MKSTSDDNDMFKLKRREFITGAVAGITAGMTGTPAIAKAGVRT